ncbi:MAG: hypothetical protein OEW08_04400 [Gammaproteobacteria bacterium]|nr:hypothetical protein [Gammaproteobacteria bacterium]
MSTNSLPSDVIELAHQIENYLSAHPVAADTLTGITRWWLVRQQVEDTKSKVERALCYLQDRGVIETRTLGNGDRLYSKHTSTAESDV